jgi:RNA polymerase sigma factor (sigma-70 family)
VTAGEAIDWPLLYERIRADPNDAVAWQRLGDGVRRWIGRGGPHDTPVDDVVAEVLAAVFESLDQAHGAATFKGFVLGKYLSARQRLLRAQAAQALSMSLPAEIDVEVAEPQSTPEDVDLRARLQACLDRLPVRERRAVELRYFEDATAARLGSELGVSEVNARQIVFRAMRRLRRCLLDEPASQADV